jgi:hypothetical protein
MAKIWGQLNDPVWWFTTVVVAILISLVAGLLTPRLDGVLGRLFSGYRLAQRRRAIKRLRAACAFSRDPAQIVMYLLFINLYTLLTLGLLLVAFANPPPAEIIGIRLWEPGTGKLVREIARLVVALAAVYSAYNITQRLGNFYLALRFYRRRRFRRNWRWKPLPVAERKALHTR